ncbi:MAG: RluA family pseudouridine synthase [Desulfatiglandaceae bacterium]
MIHDAARSFSFTISKEARDTRLDLFLSSHPSIDLSRSRIQSLITQGNVKINGRPSKPGYRLRPGDRVCLEIPPPVPLVIEPEAVLFDIIYEDHALIVLSKPPGVVVHPAPGHASGTLVHGLLAHAKDLSGIGGILRPGIVHRLDKDTSGLMVAAKHDAAHSHLARQFKQGKVKKEYAALVHGPVQGERGEIDLPIARHPERRKEMAVAPGHGRHALTLWHKIEEFKHGISLLSITLKTGRTHQIRVHLSHTGHPVMGDPVYGYGRRRLKNQLKKDAEALLPLIHRQLLHARRLGFTHPVSNRYVEYEAPLPEDMAAVLEALRSLAEH